MELFTGAGGRIERGHLSSLTSGDLGLTSGHDVLVNCSGLGARDLVGDQTMQPLRGESGVSCYMELDTFWSGQVSRVRAPWARKIILDDRSVCLFQCFTKGKGRIQISV